MLQKAPERLPQTTHRSDHDDAILCRHCRSLITRRRWQISVGGHRHRFTNPLGMNFAVCCYEQAPGVFAVGSATLDHTWFAPYLWSIVQCGSCLSHMGWHYTEGQSPPQFFGLIADQISHQPLSGDSG